jgi:probable rRNA maturation factor
MDSEEDQQIKILVKKEYTQIRVRISRLKQLVYKICQLFCEEDVTVSIAIVDDCGISRVNRKFLGHEGSTDVISFDLSDETEDSEIVFEIVVNGERARQQARIRRHSMEAELALYVTHGLLHNFGFDDLDSLSAEKMHSMEDEILQEFGYGIVYRE